MPPADDAEVKRSLDSLDQLRHDLKTSLTTIRGRAQLLARAVRRSPSLADEERVRMLNGLTSIEEAVMTMVATLDAMTDEPAADADASSSSARRTRS